MKKKNPYPYVNRADNLGEVAIEYAPAARVMLDYGLHCVGCFANRFDTVENGALLHGLSEEEVDQMLKEVNEAVAKDEKKR
ncbi:MAG: disulfide oxidoreductase [bacterium]|nr:disulfide oxidoreductase [bacterium]